MAANQESFNKSMEMGHSAAWEQNWEEAARCYRLALSEFPNDSVALTNLGMALSELQDYNGALQCYLNALQTTPEDAGLLSNLSKIYEKQGKVEDAFMNRMQAAESFLKNKQVDQAIDNFVHAVMLKPEDMNVRARLATIYDHMGKRELAAEEYLAVASLMQAAGEVKKANQVVLYALKQAPGNPDAIQAEKMLRMNQALPKPSRPKGGTGPMRMAGIEELAGGLGEPDEIRDPISEAQHRALVKLAANLFSQEEENQPAGQVSRRGIAALTRGTGGLSTDHSAKARAQLHLNRAIDSQTQGDDTVAAQELEEAIEIGLHQPEAFFDLGLLFHATEPEKAMGYLQQAVRQPEFSLASYLLMAHIHYERHDFHDSVVEYLYALSYADSEVVPADQGDALRQLYEPIIEAQHDQTDETQKKSLCDSIANLLLRKNWRAHLQKARQQLTAQAGGTAPLPLASLLIETKGGRVVDALSQIRDMTAHGHYRSAMEEAFFAIPFAATYLPLHSQMGEILAKEGRIQDAVEKFLLTAELYSLRGETGQAIQLLNRVTQMAPMDLTIRSKLIELYGLQGRTEELIKQYIELGGIYYRLAELDMAKQTFMAGLRYAQESKNGKPLVIKILSRVADIDEQRFDWRNAVRVYEQLRTMQPEDVSTRSHLIDLDLRMGQINPAVSEFQGFVALLINTGRQAEALKFAKDFCKDHPDQTVIREQYVDMLVMSKQHKEAIAELEAILPLQTEDGNKQKVAETLQKLITLNAPKAAEYKAALQDMMKKSG
jgi:tetratricopeptide (TPR) repeat protein